MQPALRNALTHNCPKKLAPIRVSTLTSEIVRSPLVESDWLLRKQGGLHAARDHAPGRLRRETGRQCQGYFFLMEQEYATGSVLLIDGGTLAPGATRNPNREHRE
jgi:hypothetical protein